MARHEYTSVRCGLLLRFPGRETRRVSDTVFWPPPPPVVSLLCSRSTSGQTNRFSLVGGPPCRNSLCSNVGAASSCGPSAENHLTVCLLWRQGGTKGDQSDARIRHRKEISSAGPSKKLFRQCATAPPNCSSLSERVNALPSVEVNKKEDNDLQQCSVETERRKSMTDANRKISKIGKGNMWRPVAAIRHLE
jgi:hypothetical protein